MLPTGNFEVLEAKDGVEGLNLIRQERPSLIMLDFLLPRLSGWEVFQALQQVPDFQSIPLVIMSGRKEEVTDKLKEPFEHFEFIEKPFETKQLVEAIKTAIFKAKRSRGLLTTQSPAGIANSGIIASQIAGLNQKINQMQSEISDLKKTVSHLVAVLQNRS